MDFFFYWYILGVAGAFLSFKAFEAGDLAGAYTRGNFCLTLFCGVLGPVTLAAAAIWWLCALGEKDFKLKGWFHDWWNTPL